MILNAQLQETGSRSRTRCVVIGAYIREAGRDMRPYILRLRPRLRRLIEQGLTSHSTQLRSFRRRIGGMKQKVSE